MYKKEILELLLQVWELDKYKTKNLSAFLFTIYQKHKIYFLPSSQELIETLEQELNTNVTEKMN